MEHFQALGISLAIGLLIGLQRSWQEISRQKDKMPILAGLRTFGLIGLLGGLWALLSQKMGDYLLAVAFVCFAALVIFSFLREPKRESGYGVTTMVASFITFALAALAVLGEPQLASAFAVMTAVLLGMKSLFTRWLEGIDQDEILGIYKFLLISVVLLPLLPDKGYGPWEVLNPFEIWWLIVLIAGISFVGYFAIKIKGTRIGVLLTSFFGGLASSTATTINFAKFARQNGNLYALLTTGVLVASATMFPRVLIEVYVVNFELGEYLVVPMGLMMVVCYIMALLYWKKKESKESSGDLPIKNPFEIIPALKFGILLTAIMILAKLAQIQLGNLGVYILAFFSGFSDVDAITLTMAKMAREGGLANQVAATAIIIAAIVNTAVKALLVLFIERGVMGRNSMLAFGLVIATGLASILLM